MSATPRGTDSAKVIQVIETSALCGKGTEEDPCWTKKQYWNFDGELLAEEKLEDIEVNREFAPFGHT